MKNILYGEDGIIINILFFLFHTYENIIDHDPSADLVAQLAQEVYRTDLLQLLVLNIQKFEFEVSRSVIPINTIFIY